MLSKKDIKNATDAFDEIKEAFKDDEVTFKDGIQKKDFERPFAAVVKNGEVIYKTFNPLENGVYIGDEKLKLEWEFDPMSTDFGIDVTQHMGDDMKLIFSLDGNIINAMESKPGEGSMTAKLQLRVKY